MPPLHSQTTFKSVNPLIGEQPTIRGVECNVAGCVKTTSLRVCAACKAATYCSRSCQKADWKVHKPFCDYRQHISRNSQGEVGSMPEELRFNEGLFMNFREAHSVTLPDIVKLSIQRHSGGELARFDFSKHYVKINCRFNEHSDFNPSIAYRLISVDIADLTEIQDEDSFISFREKAKVDHDVRRANNPSYIEAAVVVFHFTNLALSILQPFPITSTGSAYNAEAYEKLLGLINDGLIIRNVGGTKLLGRITKEAGKWRWKRLPGSAAALSSQGLDWVDH